MGKDGVQKSGVVDIEPSLAFEEGSRLAVEIVAFVDVLGDEGDIGLDRGGPTKLYWRGLPSSAILALSLLGVSRITFIFAIKKRITILPP